jgi:hypothetical protein
MGSPPPGAAAPALQWTMPAGWQEQAASGMRVGSFAVVKGEQKADVSVIPLAGISGSELDNVNRWRGQVGLAPFDAAKLAEAGEKVAIGGQQGTLYDMAGTDPQTKQPARILAAILSSQGMTWFFKMLGSDALVAEQKPAFKDFLKSVTESTATAQDQLPPSHPPLGGAGMQAGAGAMGAGGLGMGPATGEKPTWEVPAGWQEQPAASMRVATYQVTGENGAKADISVIKLAGEAGGMLANLNRWRGQVGLQPVGKADLEKQITTQEANGTKIILADMSGRAVESGEPARLVAATVPRAGGTWFYKMFGNEQLVEKQKPAFIKFVETARYPNAP